MPTARSEDALLAQLSAPGYDPTGPEESTQLRQALRKSSHHVVAKAAELAARAKLFDLAADLVAAFDRFLVNPLKSDKNCIGKIAILDALNELDFQPPDVFLRGVRYVQMEPAYGGQQDSAGPVRCRCAAALVRIDHPQTLQLLIDLLIDPLRGVRLAAVQAIGGYGSEASGHLLRLKARLGDAESEVTGECLSEMIRLQPLAAIPLAAEFLKDKDDGIVESALLALGNSRRVEAFAPLRSYWDEGPPADLRETTLVAMALLRQPEPTDFLLHLLREGRGAVAECALSALAILSYDARVRDQCQSAVAERDDDSLKQLFREKFQTGGC